MTRSAAAEHVSLDVVDDDRNESGEHEVAIELDHASERIGRLRIGVPDVDESPACLIGVATEERDVDDEITIEAPAPVIPADVPSPLGDDDDRLVPDREESGPEPKPAPKSAVREAIALAGIPAKIASPAHSSSSTLPPRPASEIPIPISDLVSLRPRISLADAQAAREAREAARRDQATTRLIVLAIWGLATVLAAFLAVAALR